MTTVLVVDDFLGDRQLVAALLREGAAVDILEADDGATALAMLGRHFPDLIVTDLMMPHVDGLQLVATVRERYPWIPVVLMTSLGSDDIAARALRAGAASYVPKRLLAEDLVDTVRRVLAVAGRQRGRVRLLGCLKRIDNNFVFGNDCTLFEPLISYVQESLVQLGFCDDGDCTRIGVALGEAIANAMYHGNLEVASQLRADDEEAYWRLVQHRCHESPYAERRIHFDAMMSHDAVEFVIRDEGPGFDPAALPDPTDPANLENVSGRGILLMRTFMDDVVYNPAGNVVTLRKQRPAALAKTTP